MMRWLVTLVTPAPQPDSPWHAGVVVTDRRESGHDLIEKANDFMGTYMLDGQVYEITRRYRVTTRTEQI